MKKRMRILWIVGGILLFLLLIADIVFARIFATPYPDAVAEANGIYMEWVEEPSREMLSYQICSSLGNLAHGDGYQLEYKFLGRWYRLVYRENATRHLEGIVVGERSDTLRQDENPTWLYSFLPPGKYRMVQKFYTVEDHVLYENRDKYIVLYLEFELD